MNALKKYITRLVSRKPDWKNRKEIVIGRFQEESDS